MSEMNQQAPYQPAPVQPAPHKKRRRWVPWAVGAGLFFLGVIIGSSGGGSTPAASTTPTTTTTVTAPAETKTVEVPGPTTTVTAPAPKASVPAPKPKPAGLPTTIDEGQWEVGVDVASGRYKTTAAVSGMCYWKITITGKPENIVDNDIVSGGKPVVTIKKGQDFKTQDCGSWAKVG